MNANIFNQLVDINPEVNNALDKGIPVVALESTIIAQSPPYPQNVERALKSENIVREGGCIPATMAILGGRIKIGLTEEEIHYVGKNAIAKVSRRDMAPVLALKGDGATTVTTTMMLAAMAGIKVFATGGIGGVHRGAEETFDISADLQELAKTNVAVIASGCKSILDTAKTLEYLETMGVPVIGYKTEDFPNFYTRTSGYKVDYKFDNEKDIAQMVQLKWDLGIDGGVVVCNPIPAEHELDYDMISTAIENATKKAQEDGIRGKEITPYILGEVYNITEGQNRIANIHLVYSNVEVATRIAAQFKNL